MTKNREQTDGETDGRTNRRTDERTDRVNEFNRAYFVQKYALISNYPDYPINRLVISIECLSNNTIFPEKNQNRVGSAKLIVLQLTIPLDIKYFRVIKKKVCCMR
jgi:hypothetical protein